MELFALLRWGLVIAALWAGGIPIATWLLGESRPWAVALALPVATVTVALPTYWVGRLHTTAGMAAGILVLVGLAALTAGRVEWPDRSAYRWPVLIFLTAFAFMLATRMAAPPVTPAAGEQFLDYSLIKAVRRAPALPIEDPWFAGDRVQYYYGRAITVGTIATAASVPTRLAFNLAIPTLYGALAAAAYGVAGWIAATTDRPARPAGITAAVLAAAGGTLATPLRLLAGLFPVEVRESLAPVLLTGLRMSREDAVEAITFGEWSYWFGRYIIPGTPDVFPAWTFFNGDLRPHMSSAPLLLLGVAVVIAIARTPAGRRRRILTYGALPAITGWIGLVNTWSVPIVLGVLGLSLWTVDRGTAGLLPTDRVWVGRSGVTGRLTEESGRLGATGAVCGAVAVGAILWGLPYYLFGMSRGEGVGFFPEGSAVGPFLLVFGGFLALFALVFVIELIDRAGADRRVVINATILGAIVAAPMIALGAGALAIVTVCGLIAWALIDRSDPDMLMVLVLAGAGLLAANELIYAKVWPFDPNAIRWNTAYKIFHAVWVLWGVAGGVAIAAILGDRVAASIDVRSVATVGIVALLVGGMLTFPAVASVERAGIAPENPTIDGLRGAEQSHSEEMAVIHWLDDREGTPVIATAPGTSIYQWVNAPSSLTGLPTVLGWNHQQGFRNESIYETRRQHLVQLFEGSDSERHAVLDRYDVTYVYVGPNERARYDLAALGDDPRLEAAVGNDAVTVYRVRSA